MKKNQAITKADVEQRAVMIGSGARGIITRDYGNGFCEFTADNGVVFTVHIAEFRINAALPDDYRTHIRAYKVERDAAGKLNLIVTRIPRVLYGFKYIAPVAPRMLAAGGMVAWYTVHLHRVLGFNAIARSHIRFG